MVWYLGYTRCFKHKIKTMDRGKKILLIWTLAGILMTGCKNMNKTQKGSVIGAAGGPAMGAIIGKASGNTALGAIIGATVGRAPCPVVGRMMIQQSEEIRRNVPGAKVE